MNELMNSTGQRKVESLKEKIPEIGRLQNDSKRLMKLVKKSSYRDSDIVDIHSLILLAKEQVKSLREDEEIEALGETIPEIEKLQDETKRLIKLITRGRSQDPDSPDVYSLIKLARETIEHLTSDED